MTSEEIKAQKEAEAQKALEQSQLQQQVKELSTKLEQLKTQDDNKKSQQIAAEQAAADAKLKAESDIKKLLEQSSGDDDLDDLSNKEILEIVANAFDTAIEAKAKTVGTEFSKPIEAMGKQLNDLQTYLLRKEAADGVNRAKNSFKDFDDYKEDISKIFDKYPGMDVKDAYLLAKSNKAITQPTAEEMETERPISLGTRQTAAEERFEKATAEGKNDPNKVIQRKGFKAALLEAANRIVQNRKESDY